MTDSDMMHPISSSCHHPWIKILSARLGSQDNLCTRYCSGTFQRLFGSKIICPIWCLSSYPYQLWFASKSNSGL